MCATWNSRMNWDGLKTPDDVTREKHRQRNRFFNGNVRAHKIGRDD